MRIRTTTRPGASPLPGLSGNHDRQQRPRWPQMDTLTPANVQRTEVLPPIFFVLITDITCARFGGGR
jgi:hypothetical protein